MPPIHGSCLCGGVKFEIAGPLMAPLNCHCSQCRKHHGSAFRSRVRCLDSLSAPQPMIFAKEEPHDDHHHYRL